LSLLGCDGRFENSGCFTYLFILFADILKEVAAEPQ
jgi:hypothetical protein